jgi:hypothetical protein
VIAKVIDDHFELPLPAGTRLDGVRLTIGMYDAQTQARLPAVDRATRERFRDDAVPLTYNGATGFRDR